MKERYRVHEKKRTLKLFRGLQVPDIFKWGVFARCKPIAWAGKKVFTGRLRAAQSFFMGTGSSLQ